MTNLQKATDYLTKVDSACMHIPGVAGTVCRVCAVTAMAQFAWEQTKELERQIEEPPGHECEGCGARINPDYGKCTRCE